MPFTFVAEQLRTLSQRGLADGDAVWSLCGLAAAVVACAVTLSLLLGALRSYRMKRIITACVPSVGGTVWPFLGHALQLNGSRPWHKMANWCFEHGSGNVVYFKVLDKHVLYVAHPLLLKRVLQTQQRVYSKDQASYKHFKCLLGQGLVTSEGDTWRHGRMLLSQAMRIDVLELVPSVGVNAAHRLIEIVGAATAKGKTADVDELYRHLTLQVIGEAVLSLPASEVDKVLPKLYLPVVHEANARVWAPWRQFMPWLGGCRHRDAALAKLNKYIADYVRARWALIVREKKEMERTGKEPLRKRDILDRYMTQLEACGEAEVLQVRDDLKTMILAGHETSAATLTWATYELLMHPEIAAKVREEAQDVFGNCDISKGECPSREEIQRLKWAPAVLRETLRKHSVVPLVMRAATRDDVIPAAEAGTARDVHVPKGCAIMVGIEAVHRRPDVWPEPEKFKPERFFDMDKVDPFAWIPFINGPRNCLGQHLSFLEMQIVLSLMFGRLDLSLAMDAKAAGTPHSYIIPTVPAEGLHVKGAKL